jgi:fatty acyl-CoA reductase
MARIYEKLFIFIEALEFFSTHEWKIGTNNVLMLTNQLEGVDKQEFNFDIRQLNWSTYWKDYVLGIRRYVLKEDDSTLPKARSDLKRMYYLNKKIFLLLIVLSMTLYGSSRMLALEELIKNSEIVLENNNMRDQTCNKQN